MYPKYFAIKLWLYLSSLAYVKNEIKHIYHTRKLNTLVLLLDFEVPILSNIKLKNSGGEENILSQSSFSTSHLQNQENFEMEPRRSKRARVEKDFGPDYYVFNIE